jgi:hypothetical protein
MNRAFIFLILYFAFPAHSVKAQNTFTFPTHLPKELCLDSMLTRSYQMTTDMYNYNIQGDFLGKTRLTGRLTYGGQPTNAQWSEVYVSTAGGENTAFPQGKQLAYLQGFSYRQNESLLSPDFFQSRLPEADPYVMNLFWDALGFEALAYACWDSLTLNREFLATDINKALTIANIGSFENKDTRITWTGVTEMNQELCAIIRYTVMNNPLHVTWEEMSMRGRSHYWGEIYVSLSDKQIEYACLTEDVLTDVRIKGQENSQIGYVVRSIHFVKTE